MLVHLGNKNRWDIIEDKGSVAFRDGTSRLGARDVTPRTNSTLFLRLRSLIGTRGSQKMARGNYVSRDPLNRRNCRQTVGFLDRLLFKRQFVARWLRSGGSTSIDILRHVVTARNQHRERHPERLSHSAVSISPEPWFTKASFEVAQFWLFVVVVLNPPRRMGLVLGIERAVSNAITSTIKPGEEWIRASRGSKIATSKSACYGAGSATNDRMEDRWKY